MTRLRPLLQLVQFIRNSSRHPSLRELGRRAGRSPSHLQREFQRMVGESPKQYTLRLRLEHAAARLVGGEASVLAVALASGFTHHEVFTRAFRRRFGVTPEAYRMRTSAKIRRPARLQHARLSNALMPCVTLFHLPTREQPRSSPMPTVNITLEQRAPVSALVMRRRISRTQTPATLAECYNEIIGAIHQQSLGFSGRPFARYLAVSYGLITIEPGLPVTGDARSQGAIEAVTLPGGSVLVGLHSGKYEQLDETYAAMERWMEQNQAKPGGAPWESYLNDPADYPEPADWRTEICWPIK
jgi:AraC family transcriptional regulator